MYRTLGGGVMGGSGKAARRSTAGWTRRYGTLERGGHGQAQARGAYDRVLEREGFAAAEFVGVEPSGPFFHRSSPLSDEA